MTAKLRPVSKDATPQERKKQFSLRSELIPQAFGLLKPAVVKLCLAIADGIEMIKQVFKFIIASVVAVTSQKAFAQTAEHLLSRETFFARAFANWEQMANDPSSAADLKAGETGYLALNQLIPGQDEISVDNVFAKLDKKLSSGDVLVVDGAARLAFDSGRSTVAVDDPIEVVKGPMGYLILDGHHDVYLALALNGRTISAEVKRDYSHLSVEEFWKKMREESAVYLKASNEELIKNPPRMTEVSDNPNRYAAAIIALKAKLEKGQTQPSVRKVKGPKRPVWIKAGRGVPFIEFYIAQALSDAGFEYKREWGTTMPDEAVEQVRAILLSAKRTSRIPQLRTLIVIESAHSAKMLRKNKSILDLRLHHEQINEKGVRCEMNFGVRG